MNRFIKVYLYTTSVLFLFLTAQEVLSEYLADENFKDPYTNPLIPLAYFISDPLILIPVLVTALFYTIGYIRPLDPNRKHGALRNIVGVLLGLGIGFTFLPGIIYFGHGLSYYVPLAAILALLAYNTAMVVRRFLDQHSFIRALIYISIPIFLLAVVGTYSHWLTGESSDSTGCESHRLNSETGEAERCYRKRAVENPNDYAACATLTTESRQVACLYGYYGEALAVEKDEIKYAVVEVDDPRALCSLTPSGSHPEHHCWMFYAIAQKDITLCDGNRTETFASTCRRVTQEYIDGL